MNLDEVKKHVKFDMFLTTLIYIMIAVCLFLALIFTLAIPAKADSMKVYCSSGDYSSCVALYQGNNPTTLNTNVINNFNTSSSYRYFTITSMSLQKNVKYLFKITYKPTAKELKNVYFKEYSTDIEGNTSSADGYLNFSIDSSWSTGGYQSTATFTYQPSDSYRRNTSNYINLDFGSSGVTITGIDITEVDSQTAISLDELKDQQQELLSDECTNVFDTTAVNGYQEGDSSILESSDKGVIIHSTYGYGWVGFTLNLEQGKTYYIKGRALSSQPQNVNAMVVVGTRPDSYASRVYEYSGNGSFSGGFIATSNQMEVRLYGTTNNSNANSSYYEIMISPDDKPFCVFGSSLSKIDWINSGLSALNFTQEQIKDLQQQQNDYLMDDSDPTINNSEINNVLGSVNVQDPLNYLLTLPLNLLTKLNTVISSGTCSKASFGELYGTELYLPCINFENYLGSSLWGTIDTIVGIGLLAIILKKFYDTISNILSLGKEEEIRKGMELPTPMEFFAQILGGGR